MKVLSYYGIPDKYVKLISAMYENSIAVVKVRNEVSSWFRIASVIKKGCVPSPFIWITLMDFVLRSSAKAVGELEMKWRRKTSKLRLC